MGYKLNVFTGTLDVVGKSAGSGGVARVGPTNDRRITIWAGNSSDSIQNSRAEVQEGGAVQAQAFVGRKEIDGPVSIPSKHYMISSGITIMSTGSVTVDSDSELLII
jgi:hypothetical protein